ncbi:hypothetical protein ELH65_09170 [Rhizobium ruizarguesonis]|nr:hypothetical protein ELH65_09170 [Rhizobium ruizarguesonis]
MNSSDRVHLSRVAALGCIVVFPDSGERCCSPAEIHHPRDGQGMGQRADHSQAITLYFARHSAPRSVGFDLSRPQDRNAIWANYLIRIRQIILLLVAGSEALHSATSYVTGIGLGSGVRIFDEWSRLVGWGGTMPNRQRREYRRP